MSEFSASIYKEDQGGMSGPITQSGQLEAYGKAVADKHRVVFVVPSEEEANAREILQLLNLGGLGGI